MEQLPRITYLHVDMDDVLCDFTGAFENNTKANPAIAYPQSQYGFYTGLKPLPGAIGSVNQLRQDQRFDVWILTAPSIYNPMCYTEKRVWVEQHFDLEFTERLIISPDKGLLKGDILIDDNISGRGQERFEGEVIQFGSNRFPGWREVMGYLLAVK